jgi:hypothetical protein
MNEETQDGINPLVAQVVSAADAVRSQIRALDDEISGLQQQRRKITDAPVSKADFMEYVREDISRRAKLFPRMLKVKWADRMPFNNFEKLERMHDGHARGLQPFPYISGDLEKEGVDLEPSGFYWYFGDLIVERFEQAIEGLDWPADAIAVSERRQRIEELDSRTKDLIDRRDVLTAQLKIALGA